MAENKYLASLSEESRYEMIKNAEFHGSFYDVVAIDERRTGFYLVKQVGVVAHLFELHENIQELNPIFASHAIDSGDVSRDDLLVKLLLELGQPDEHENLLSIWQVLFDIRLESPQHKWLEQPMNLLDDFLLLLLIALSFIVKHEEVVEVLGGFE